MSRSMSAAVLAIALVAGSPAYADMSRGVISAFRGQFVVTKNDLPEGKNEKDKITNAKCVNMQQITYSTTTIPPSCCTVVR